MCMHMHVVFKWCRLCMKICVCAYMWCIACACACTLCMTGMQVASEYFVHTAGTFVCACIHVVQCLRAHMWMSAVCEGSIYYECKHVFCMHVVPSRSLMAAVLGMPDVCETEVQISWETADSPGPTLSPAPKDSLQADPITCWAAFGFSLSARWSWTFETRHAEGPLHF